MSLLRDTPAYLFNFTHL